MNYADYSWMEWAVLLIAGLPLLAAVLGYTATAANPRASRLPSFLLGIGALAGSAVASISLWLHTADGPLRIRLPWVTLPDDGSLAMATEGTIKGLQIPLAFQAGQIQLLFTITAALIGIVVWLYAWRDRRNDPRAGTFFATLALFTGAMLLLLTADTLLVIVAAWELMGVASYLLIAHPGTVEARRAARQAFWTTRTTDFGLLFAVITLMVVFRWALLSDVDVAGFLAAAAQAGQPLEPYYAWFGAVAIGILLATLGKSAQWPLSFWLPDAMVAPTPVSALLHAATMVAAGPFLMIELRQLFTVSDLAMALAVTVGGISMLSGALNALGAQEPKRILAYSTISHLGLIVASVGLMAEEAGYFHLLAHAWFKAALFLGVGVIVYRYGRRADFRQPEGPPELFTVAGKATQHPGILYGVLVPAGLALAGIWPLAGALGKEQVFFAAMTRTIAEPQAGMQLGEAFPLAALSWGLAAFIFLLNIPLTAAYTARLVGIMGWGKPEQLALTTPEGTNDPPPADAPPVREDNWNIATYGAACLALVGSLGGTLWWLMWYATDAGLKAPGTTWKWSSGHWGVALLIIAMVLALAGGGAAWLLRVANPVLGHRIFRRGFFAPVAAFFRAGSRHMRNMVHHVVGSLGYLFAVLAGRADSELLDNLVTGTGRAGRSTAHGCHWFDNRVIDNLRLWSCQLWWALKALHARYMQTGQIQHYMFIVLLGAVILGLVVLRPLGKILAGIIGRM